MAKFSTRTIDAVTETLIDYRGKTPPKSDSGIKLVTAKVIKDGFIQNGNHEYITEETYDTWMRRGLPKQWDILITTEAPLGQVAQLRTAEKVALAQRVILLRGHPDIIDQQYYFQSIKSPFVQGQLMARATGTTVLGIKQSELRHVEIPYYPLPIQRKIAAILSAYDDLIENNTQRIAILEEMAQTIYREWFVRFRFPGHEGVEMIESELGPIPEGWEVKPVSEVAEVYRGRSYRSQDLVEEGSLPFLNLKCVARDGGFRRDGLKRYAGRFKETQKAKPGDIIIAVTDMTQERRIVARAARVPDMTEKTFVFSMDLVKVMPREDIPSDYLYGMLRFSRFPDEVKQHANGANVLHLRPDRITEFEFPLGPKRLRDQYDSVMAPIYQEQDVLQNKSDILRQARDLLLPRLISGEIDVSELEIMG
jgi:type I restriction enzyme S subunit